MSSFPWIGNTYYQEPSHKEVSTMRSFKNFNYEEKEETYKTNFDK